MRSALLNTKQKSFVIYEVEINFLVACLSRCLSHLFTFSIHGVEIEKICCLTLNLKKTISFFSQIFIFFTKCLFFLPSAYLCLDGPRA